MKKIVTKLLSTALAFMGLWGCNDDILPEISNPDYSIIDGDTIKIRSDSDLLSTQARKTLIYGSGNTIIGDTILGYTKSKLHFLPSKAPDLSRIKNNEDAELKGKPLKMVALGGSLTSGVCDGGYFNEGIETSYPNLLAKQMKLEEFEQPLFDSQDYNGFKRKVVSLLNYTGGPIPKFKSVLNNTGIESFVITSGAFEMGTVENVKLKAYSNYNNLNNRAIPDLRIGALIK